jgi:hypothetical protein
MPCGHQDIFYKKFWGLQDPTSQPFTANGDFPWYVANHSPPSGAVAKNDELNFHCPCMPSWRVQRLDVVEFLWPQHLGKSSLPHPVYLFLTFINITFMFVFHSGSLPTTKQPCWRIYVLPFPILPTIFSSRHLPLYLMMKTEDAFATLAPMWQRKRGFTHAGPRTHAHIFTAVYRRHNTQRKRGYFCILHCSPCLTKCTYLSK